MSLLGMLLSSCSPGKVKATRELEPFDRVSIVGNGQLHLEKSSNHSMQIKAKSETDLENLVTEVRDGELQIYHKEAGENRETPGYAIYLSYTDISDLSITGSYKVRSDEPIFQDDLSIRSHGVLRGSLQVSVKNLDVNLSGVSRFSISGHADSTAMSIRGVGKLITSGLKSQHENKASYGLAAIN